MTTLAEQFAGRPVPQSFKQRTKPLWDGPTSDTLNGGVTFSLLSKFLACRERFRIAVIEGIKPKEQWNHKIGYGNMWHVCEESLAAKKDWEPALHAYCSSLVSAFRHKEADIEHWWMVCKTQFPFYVRYWGRHPDVISRKPVFQEQVFSVHYELPSGRVIVIRGKFDAVDYIDGGLYIQENKTKADIDVLALQRQLPFDLQSMMYLTALYGLKEQGHPKVHKHHISGVRYNVVRRPLSGGKGTIVQHKPTKKNPLGETKEAFYSRVNDVIKADPEHFFSRWKTDVSVDDLKRFQLQTLDPILEQLCNWYDWIISCGGDPFNERNKLHFRFPYGSSTYIMDGGFGDVDAYLDDGSTVGLYQNDTLFQELR